MNGHFSIAGSVFPLDQHRRAFCLPRGTFAADEWIPCPPTSIIRASCRKKTTLQEAQNPNTLPRRLREIVGREWNSEAGRAVAAHPNAPPDLLARLAPWYPEAVLGNPALPLVMLEDPSWAAKLQPKVALALLRFESVPAGLLHTLTDKPGALGQAARLHVGVAGECGPDWEDEARRALWEASGLREQSGLPGRNDREKPFPVRLLSLGLVADWLTEPLAAHEDARVRRAVARSPQTPRDVLTLLRRAGSTSDLGGLAPPDLTLPGSVLDRMAWGGPWAKRLAARHPNTPPDVLTRLAQDDDETLRRHLVRNSAVPAPLRASSGRQCRPRLPAGVGTGPRNAPNRPGNAGLRRRPGRALDGGPQPEHAPGGPGSDIGRGRRRPRPAGCRPERRRPGWSAGRTGR